MTENEKPIGGINAAHQQRFDSSKAKIKWATRYTHFHNTTVPSLILQRIFYTAHTADILS